MATIAEQLTSLANTKTAIKNAIVAKGVTVADDTPFSGYAAKIGEIQGGGGVATFLGLGFDQWAGVLNENGAFDLTANPFEFDAVGIKSIIGYFVFWKKFSNNPKVTSCRFPDLTTINGERACSSMFDHDSGLIRAELENLTKIDGYYSCQGMFEYCANLIYANIENLTSVDGSYSCASMFARTSLTRAGLENLTEVLGAGSIQQMYNGCKGLTKEYFPMLVTVSQKSGMGSYSSNGTFVNCTNLTEIHFRADAQAVIEGLSGYSSKFGATNATIYFDLIGTITVGGVAYARDEKQSIRVDGTKTFVAWKDADSNVVYTSYADNAEPAVGTAVYSDAGTTQVGTVEGVA